LHRALDLFLLLALGVSLIAMLAGILRMLLGVCRMFLALGVVAVAMLFRCRTVRFGGVLMMFGCFVMLVLSHQVSPSRWGVREKQRLSAFGSYFDALYFHKAYLDGVFDLLRALLITGDRGVP
jgi:hypothetical protein